MAHTYEYPRPALTVDCVVFGLDEELQVLLIRRGLEPFAGRWALPGNLIRDDESLDEAAHRVLFELTGLDHLYLEQFQAFGDPDRDGDLDLFASGICFATPTNQCRDALGWTGNRLFVRTATGGWTDTASVTGSSVPSLSFFSQLLCSY